MTPGLSASTARAWLRTWDAQQEAYNPDRERLFERMFDAAEATVGRRFVALDLGSGPGSLSARLLRRFPAARCVAVDFDPVVLQIGRTALGSVGGRLRWVDARLGGPGWTRALPVRRVDVALSTTALHWLPPAPLRALYRDLHRLLRPGGLFLNGDRLRWGRRDAGLDTIGGRIRKVRQRRTGRGSGHGSWDRWWRTVHRDPRLAPAFAEQARRHAEHPTHRDRPVDDHLAALRAAGFRTVGFLWSDLDHRLLAARR